MIVFPDFPIPMIHYELIFWRAAAAAAADDLLLGHFGPELLEDDFCLGVVVAYLELEIGLRLTSCWIWSMHDNGLGGQFVQVTD
jgi:hypothetical protein